MRVFQPLIVIEDRGQQACSRPLASEADLVRHKEAEVENPVKEIIDQLAPSYRPQPQSQLCYRSALSTLIL
jgi:hypothetical protein